MPNSTIRLIITIDKGKYILPNQPEIEKTSRTPPTYLSCRSFVLTPTMYRLIDFSWLGLGPRAIRKLLFLSSAFVAEAEEEKLFYLVPFYHQKCKKRNLIDS